MRKDFEKIPNLIKSFPPLAIGIIVRILDAVGTEHDFDEVVKKKKNFMAKKSSPPLRE